MVPAVPEAKLINYLYQYGYTFMRKYMHFIKPSARNSSFDVSESFMGLC